MDKTQCPAVSSVSVSIIIEKGAWWYSIIILWCYGQRRSEIWSICSNATCMLYICDRIVDTWEMIIILYFLRTRQSLKKVPMFWNLLFSLVEGNIHGMKCLFQAFTTSSTAITKHSQSKSPWSSCSEKKEPSCFLSVPLTVLKHFHRGDDKRQLIHVLSSFVKQKRDQPCLRSRNFTRKIQSRIHVSRKFWYLSWILCEENFPPSKTKMT